MTIVFENAGAPDALGNLNGILWASVTCPSLKDTLCQHVLNVVTSSADCVIEEKSCERTISSYLGTNHLMGLYSPTLSYYRKLWERLLVS